MVGLAFRVARKGRRWWNAVTHPSALSMLAYLSTSKRKLGKIQAIPDDTPPAVGVEFLVDPVPSSLDIPPLIFQTWKSRTEIPSNYRRWRLTFTTLNPGFRQLLWDDDDNRAFIEARFPWFLSTYEAYPREIYRADAVRPFFLFLFGGFYADMDSECLRPLEPLRARAAVLLGRMGRDEKFEHSVPNALMASRPFQLFWLVVVAMMIDHAKGAGAEAMDVAGPETFTGPILLKEAYDFYVGATPSERRARCQPVLDLLPAHWIAHVEDGKLELLGPDEWYPIDWTNPIHRRLRNRVMTRREPLNREDALRLFPKATLVTYWSHSW